MKVMGIESTQEEAKEIFETVDRNRDGKISLSEFSSYIGK